MSQIVVEDLRHLYRPKRGTPVLAGVVLRWQHGHGGGEMASGW